MTDPIIVKRSVGSPKKFNPFFKFGPNMTSEVLEEVTVSLKELVGSKELVTERVTAS